MPDKHVHPFCIDVRASRFGSGFSWTIRERGGPDRHSGTTHQTFEAARVEGKAVLDGLVAEWSRSRRAPDTELGTA